MAVQAGTALGEAGEALWDTIQLQRGDTLLMVVNSRHHGLPALHGAKDGLQSAFSFNFWTPDPRPCHHQPTSTHPNPAPPRRPWPLLEICLAGTSPASTRYCGLERGR